MSIEYEVTEDRGKLVAAYQLEEQFRLAHNQVGQQAAAYPERYIATGRWKQYSKLWKARVEVIHADILALKTKIQLQNIPIDEWRRQMESPDPGIFALDLFGDKADFKRGIQINSKIPATLPTLQELLNFRLDDIPAREPIDPYQDFLADYTEVDTPGHLSVAQYVITVTNLGRGEDCIVYRDFGAAHFGALMDHLTTINCTGSTAGGPALSCWQPANGNSAPLANPYLSLHANNKDASNYKLNLYVNDGADVQVDITSSIAYSTPEYPEIDRNAVDLDAYIYSDAVRTVLWDTLTVLKGSSSFRYMTICESWNGYGDTISGVVSNLDLQEGGGGTSAAALSGGAGIVTGAGVARLIL